MYAYIRSYLFAPSMMILLFIILGVKIFAKSRLIADFSNGLTVHTIYSNIMKITHYLLTYVHIFVVQLLLAVPVPCTQLKGDINFTSSTSN